jgi:hypothetical protein
LRSDEDMDLQSAISNLNLQIFERQAPPRNLLKVNNLISVPYEFCSYFCAPSRTMNLRLTLELLRSTSISA